jgi:transcriptional regulator GlxA family with amidase domain
MQDLVFKPGSGGLEFDYITPFFSPGPFIKNKNRIYADTDHLVINTLKKMDKELNAKQTYYQHTAKNHLLDILLILLRNYGKKAKRSKKNINKVRDIERLKSVIGYIQDHYNRKITLSHLSKIACMSPTSFCHYFKKATGTTTSNYIMRTRIDHAKEFLIKSDLSITRIAFEVGIEDHSYFDRIFRRFNHMSPKDFRKNYTTRIS